MESCQNDRRRKKKKKKKCERGKELFGLTVLHRWFISGEFCEVDKMELVKKTCYSMKEIEGAVALLGYQ